MSRGAERSENWRTGEAAAASCDETNYQSGNEEESSGDNLRDGYEKARARTLPIGNEEIFDEGSSGSTIEARPYDSSVPHAAAGWLTWAQLTAHLASPIFVFTCHEAIIRID